MAGDVGGFGEFIYVCIFLVIGGYANRMFYAELIQEMFHVRLDKTLNRSGTQLMNAEHKANSRKE